MMDKCDEHLAAAAKISHDGTDRFVVFLKNAVKDIDVEPLIKRKIIDVLKPNPSKKECYGIKLVGESSRFEWRKEWKEVIQCAVKNSSSSYLCDYKSEIEQIWMEFIKKACPEKTPIIRKPEVWAAVLEYIYCSANLIRITKAELAQKYKISAASITRKLNAINTWCST